MKTPSPIKQLSNPVSESSDCSPLRWRKGPAQKGGEGTAGVDELGKAVWWDGETIMTIVRTNGGMEYDILNVSTDEGTAYLQLQSTGDDWGWTFNEILWWAKIEAENLPKENIPDRASASD
jgi:hypothetical protein